MQMHACERIDLADSPYSVSHVLVFACVTMLTKGLSVTRITQHLPCGTTYNLKLVTCGSYNLKMFHYSQPESPYNKVFDSC